MGIHITCKKAVDYISKKEEGKLSLWHRVQLWKHLAVCNQCRRFLDQNKMFSSPHEHTHHLSASRKNEIKEAVLKELNKH